MENPRYEAYYDHAGHRWVVACRRGQAVLSPCTTEMAAKDFAEALNEAARRRIERGETD